jgi:hypothetical protein
MYLKQIICFHGSAMISKSTSSKNRTPPRQTVALKVSRGAALATLRSFESFAREQAAIPEARRRRRRELGEAFILAMQHAQAAGQPAYEKRAFATLATLLPGTVWFGVNPSADITKDINRKITNLGRRLKECVKRHPAGAGRNWCFRLAFVHFLFCEL